MNQSINGDTDSSLSGSSMNRVLPNSICVLPNVRVQAEKANGANGGYNPKVCALIRF